MERLSKVLAQAGVASRRRAESIIQAGRVSVNEKVVTIPQTRVSLGKDRISVDGETVVAKEKKHYYVLNKPRGIICTCDEGRRSLISLFSNVPARLFPVGRLDRDTSGLILVTNDGHYAQEVIHPSSGIHKEYVAKVNRDITDTHLKVMSSGTEVEGKWVSPVSVRKVRRCTLKVVVGEGRRHEVRRLIQAAGLEVIELKRVRIGSLHLGSLPVGAYRSLSESERHSVFN
ncbi:MAG: rRNA pseudouridine synthase [Simkaniaceae bacterium]|nr:rRNA pseudouridine synthase [Simkaniaceae bacterium]